MSISKSEFLEHMEYLRDIYAVYIHQMEGNSELVTSVYNNYGCCLLSAIMGKDYLDIPDEDENIFWDTIENPNHPTHQELEDLYDKLTNI